MRKQTPKKSAVGLGWGNSERETAKELIEKTFEKLKTVTVLKEGATDKFFPHGIELIHFKFKFSSSIDFEVKIAGAVAVKNLLGGNQIISWEQTPSEKTL